MPEPTEFEIQRAFTKWFKGERWKKGPQKGEWKVFPAMRPGVVAWHTPNNGKRDQGGGLEGTWLQDIGMEAGIHDYLFLWGGLYGLEFKKPGGALSSAQKRMQPMLLAAGMVASETVDNLQDARAFVIRHGLVA